MKKLFLAVLFLVSGLVKSQTDTSLLEKMTPEELMKYYQNEKPPRSNYKGQTKIGDSLYRKLNNLVIPTRTVNTKQFLRLDDEEMMTKPQDDDSSSALQQMKPKVAIGAGRLGFYGDLYTKRFQSPLISRPALDLNLSQRLSRSLQLNFNVLFGTVGANERRGDRNENFQSEIRAGGLNLLYDFGDFIPDKYTVRPFISIGAMGFEFLSKTDLKDKNGNTYYYWNDGSIKDRAQDAPDAQFAKELRRDYSYETDIRERNADGFGKYREAALAFPVGAGAIMKVTDRLDFKLNFQLFFTTTDYIDGISNESKGSRIGNKQKDNFSYTSFALQYDMITSPKRRTKLGKDTLGDKFWLAKDTGDSDDDGVPDFEDECHGTPVGVKVNSKGCPLDDDKDGVPNYKDDELGTQVGKIVDKKGVALADNHFQDWYAQFYNDSTSREKQEEYIGNHLVLASKNKAAAKAKKEIYTVELARYTGGIPADQLALLVSIGNVRSVSLNNGTTMVYAVGEYTNLASAVKFRDEYRKQGHKGAVISKVKGRNLERMSDEDAEKLLKKLEADSPEAVKSGTASAEGEDEFFNKTDVVYRVQLGAFKNKISINVFNTSAGVLELKTNDNSYRYVTKGFKTIAEAAAMRADLVVQGYSDAFVTAYRDGKRIPLSETKATVEKTFKEDLDEDKKFSSVDKKLVVFKVQLGPLKKPETEKSMDDKVKGISDIEKQITGSGSIRYVAGTFYGMAAAEKYRAELENKGFTDAFIIATFKGDIISIQEALELLK
jgi:hypothetical protein